MDGDTSLGSSIWPKKCMKRVGDKSSEWENRPRGMLREVIILR